MLDMAVTRFFQKFTVNGVDNLSNPLKLVMTENKKVEAVYEENEVGTVRFNGTVSGQAVAGRSIVITVTKIGGGVATVNAVTLADKTFSATYLAVVGDYSAVAKALADVEYEEGVSPSVTFTINKLSTTVTLTVTL